MTEDPGFLSRWSRRKAQAQVTAVPPVPPVPPEPPPAPASPPAPEAPRAATEPAQPPAEAPPSLDDVAGLTHESDFSRFVGRGVDADVKSAALKKLFGDPRFNVMDGLDTYIDDYGQPDPLPASWLRQMTQSRVLGLFAEEAEPTATATTEPAAPPPLPAPIDDEDTDLRLQPDDTAGPAGVEPGAGQDPRRQC
jgi:hypothetical protein